MSVVLMLEKLNFNIIFLTFFLFSLQNYLSVKIVRPNA